MPFLSLLTGGIGKYIGIGMIAVALAGALAWAVHSYDSGIRAEVQASAQAQEIAVIRADQKRAEFALDLVTREKEELRSKFDELHSKINEMPRTTACVGSPAIRAALDGLRGHGRPDPAAAAPGHP